MCVFFVHNEDDNNRERYCASTASFEDYALMVLVVVTVVVLMVEFHIHNVVWLPHIYKDERRKECTVCGTVAHHFS